MIGISLGLPLGSTGVGNAIAAVSTALEYTRAATDSIVVRLTGVPADATVGEALSIAATGWTPAEALTAPQMLDNTAPGAQTGSNQNVTPLNVAPVVGAWYLISYTVTANGGTGQVFPSAASPFGDTSGSDFPADIGGPYFVFAQATTTSQTTAFRTNNAITIAEASVRPCSWSATLTGATAGDALSYVMTRGEAVGRGSTVVPVAGEYYVSPNGSDTTGSGAQASPMQTPEYAQTLAAAGDDIVIMPGDHNPFEVTISGTTGNEITFRSMPGEVANTRIVGRIDTDTLSGVVYGNEWRDCIYGAGREHVIIDGLTFRDPWRCGVAFFADPDNDSYGTTLEGITIQNCDFANIGSSAIRVEGINSDNVLNLGETTPRYDDVLIDGNTVTATNIQNANLPNVDSEAISVAAGVRNPVTTNNTIHDSNGYGIDYKAGVEGGEISGNTIYGMENFGIYLDAGRRWVRDVTVKNNHVYASKNGIVMAREAAPTSGTYAEGVASLGAPEFIQELSGIDVYNNLITDCDESGLYLQPHPRDGGNGTITNNRFRFNTLVDNGVTSGKDLNLYGWGDLGITLSGLDLTGNLAYNTGRAISVANGTIATGFTVADNLNFTEGDNTDPLFIDAANNDYGLGDGSPAAGIVDGASASPFNTDYDGTARTDPANAGYTQAGTSVVELTGLTIDTGVDPNEIQVAVDGTWTEVHWQVDNNASYANTTAMEAVTPLVSGSFTSVPATLDLSGLAYGDYYLHAYAENAAGAQVAAPISQPISRVEEVVAPVSNAPVVLSSAFIRESSTVANSWSTDAVTAAAGTDRLWVVSLSSRFLTSSASADPQMSVNGTALTRLFFSPQDFQLGVTVFVLKEADIPAGSNTLDFTQVGGIGEHTVQLIEMEDVDQTTSVGTIVESFQFSGSSSSIIGTTTINDSLLLSSTAIKAITTNDISASTNSGGTLSSSVNGEAVGFNSNQSVTAMAAWEGVATTTSVTHSYDYDDGSGSNMTVAMEIFKA